MEVMDRTQRLEEELAQTKHALHRAKSLLSLINGHVYSKDVDGIILDCNLQQARSAGYESIEQFIGKTDYDYLSQQDADRVRALDKQVMQTRQILTKEEVGYLPDGRHYTFLSTKAPLYDITQQYVIGIIGISMDITQQKQEAQQAKESQEYYEHIISQIPGHVYWLNANSVYLGCNDEQAQDANLTSRKDIVGKTNREMIWNQYAEELDVINRRVLNGETIVDEEDCLFTGGTGIWYSKKTPLYNEAGQVIGVLGISIDISDRKKAERLTIKNIKIEKMREEADRYAQRMKIIAANISHELRTPLAGIKLTLQVIQQSFTRLIGDYLTIIKSNLIDQPLTKQQIDTMHDLFNRAVGQVDRANTMISIQLNNIRHNKLQTKHFQNYAIAEVITDAIVQYPFIPGEKEQIHLQLDGDFVFYGDSLLLRHVIWNLLKNALYCIKEEGKGEINIWLETKDNANRLYFKDTAKGMNQEQSQKVFKEFYSKTPDGSGLGLAFCRSVMDAFGGSIKCRAELGEFAEFVLLFPAIKVKD